MLQCKVWWAYLFTAVGLLTMQIFIAFWLGQNSFLNLKINDGGSGKEPAITNIPSWSDPFSGRWNCVSFALEWLLFLIVEIGIPRY